MHDSTSSEASAQGSGGPATTATWPVLVIGAGAAGLMAAIFAARGGQRVLILDSRERPGAKIRVSGGGRCNVLPSRASLEDFQTHGSPHALRKLLAAWPLADVRAFFERDLGIALKAEETGKVFPASEDPREVVAALLDAARAAGAVLLGGERVEVLTALDPAGAAAAGHPGARFELRTSQGRVWLARHVVVATGGFSLPKTGSDGLGWRLLAQLGHALHPDHPALVPLLARDPTWGELAGITVSARLTAARPGRAPRVCQGDFLFTHRGFSGPVVLDVSQALTEPGAENARLSARWIGQGDPSWDAWLQQGGRRSVAGALRDALPRRLVERLLARAGVDGERRLSELARTERVQLVRELDACPLEVAGNEGYRTAEVTAGGVPLEELSTRTLESRRVPGLHCAGEVVDVTGRIGGYNFLWAWVSGRTVGRALAEQAQA